MDFKAERDAAINDVELAEKRLASRGGTEASYIALYGSVSVPPFRGDGGEAIYAADVACLVAAQARLAALSKKGEIIVDEVPDNLVPVLRTVNQTLNDILTTYQAAIDPVVWEEAKQVFRDTRTFIQSLLKDV